MTSAGNPSVGRLSASGLARGPGFPNLSCLGLLSDRVLRRYVAPEEPAARTASERRELV
jgi:hypothetical protein